MNELNRREQKNRLDLWDCATAAEACIALEDYGAALHWVEKCTQQFPNVDAFTLGSFERQLREVWGMTPEREPGSFFLPVVRKELLKQEGGAVEITADDMHVSKAQKKGDEKQLEKILGNTGVQSYRWWMRGVARAQTRSNRPGCGSRRRNGISGERKRSAGFVRG